MQARVTTNSQSTSTSSGQLRPRVGRGNFFFHYYFFMPRTSWQKISEWIMTDAGIMMVNIGNCAKYMFDMFFVSQFQCFSLTLCCAAMMTSYVRHDWNPDSTAVDLLGLCSASSTKTMGYSAFGR
jgi:hypothetical protein